MYRLIQCRTVVADDSSLQQTTFDRSCTVYQTQDLEAAAPTIRVAPGASDTQVVLGSVGTGYAISIFADYPIMVRLNGAMATQFIMTRSTVQPRNNGAPLPPECCFVATIEVTSLYVEPIENAAQTANVWVCVTGDPASAY